MPRLYSASCLLLCACIANQVTPASPRDCDLAGDCESAEDTDPADPHDTDAAGNTDAVGDTDAVDDTADTDSEPTSALALRSVLISPDPAFNDDVLQCEADADLGSDGSALLTFLWTRVANGAEVGEGASLDLSAATPWPPGTALRCQARVTQGLTELTAAVAVVLSNRPPEVSGVTVVPASPRVGDTARCEGAATDPDGDAMSWSYAWSHGATDAEVLVTQDLGAPGTTLSCTATVSDGRGGTDAGDGSAVIDNTPPVVTSVSVSPAVARVGETVTCSALASDADGDPPSLSYTWSSGATGADYTLTADDDPGSELVCMATASDALDATLTHSLASSPGVMVQNTPPVVTSVSVSPATVRVGDVVTCSAEASDADGDVPAMSYAWSTGAVGPSTTVSPSQPRGTTITCTAIATDALDASLSGSDTASIEVANSPPVVTQVSITPSVARTQDTLTAVVDAFDADGDALTYTYAWHVEGEVLAGETGPSLGPSRFVKGQSVVLSVTASDGSASGANASSPRVIANTPPGAPGVELNPWNALEGEPLECVVTSAAADPDVDDGVDSLTYSFGWTLNGSTFSGATSAALSSRVAAHHVRAGQLWDCSVVAHDGSQAGPAADADVFVESGVAGNVSSSARLGSLRFIPSGSFTMGCVEPRDVVHDVTACSGRIWELPTRTVNLTRSFWMMESELTQGMWSGLGFTNPSSFSGADHPVETVSWWEALEASNEASRRDGLVECYTLTGCTGAVGSDHVCTGVTVTSTSGHPKDCAGWRLPTEAEWEYAARAGTSTSFSGGSDESEVAWHGSNSGSQTKAVCTTPTPRNAWGLCDMSGNVREWTWDRYAPSYSGAATTDPAGPASGTDRVGRGGSWGSSAQDVRVAGRISGSPVGRNGGLGFRLVRSVP